MQWDVGVARYMRGCDSRDSGSILLLPYFQFFRLVRGVNKRVGVILSNNVSYNFNI